MQTIGDLYVSNMQPDERNSKRDTQYRWALDNAIKADDAFRATLTDEQKKTVRGAHGRPAGTQHSDRSRDFYIFLPPRRKDHDGGTKKDANSSFLVFCTSSLDEEIRFPSFTKCCCWNNLSKNSNWLSSIFKQLFWYH